MLSGVTVLTFGSAGLIASVALHHRPPGAALAFWAETGRRRGDSVGHRRFLPGPQDG